MTHLDHLGFEEAWMGEHHSTGAEIVPAPDIFIAAAAERTERIQFGTGVTSLPYHHPLITADRITQLDELGFEFSRHKLAEGRRALELNLNGHASSNTTVDLSWIAPELDASGVSIAGYKIYRNGTAIDETQTTSYTDQTAEAGETYQYTISVIYKLRGTDYESSARTRAVTVAVPSSGNGNDDEDD
jgi:hypothetical protein